MNQSLESWTSKMAFRIYHRFGLELEFARKTKREKLAQIISEAVPEDKVLITSWQKNTNNTEWICKTDSSCGYEVCTPVFDSLTDLERLQKVLKGFTENNTHITKSCGVHVHVESKLFTIYQMKKILVNWINFENVIFQMFPQFRRINRFCLPLAGFVKKEKYSPTALLRTVSKHKNRSLNARGFATRGTIEFRLMEGTVDAEDITNWVVFCQKFVERSVSEKSQELFAQGGLSELLTFLNLEDKAEQDLKKWILKRIRTFE